MSFARVLRRIVEESGGGLAAILMGRDGIPIEQVEAPGVSPDEAERLGNAGVELGRIEVLLERRDSCVTLDHWPSTLAGTSATNGDALQPSELSKAASKASSEGAKSSERSSSQASAAPCSRSMPSSSHSNHSPSSTPST